MNGYRKAIVGVAVLVPVAAVYLSAQAPTVPQIARAREAANRTKSLTDVEKKQILDLYDAALKSVDATLRFQAIKLGQERKLETAKQELENLRKEASQPMVERAPSLPANASTQTVEEALSQAQADRDARAKAIASLTEQSVTLSRRREEIIRRRADLRRDLESADDQLAVIKVSSVSELWEQAARTELLARKNAIEAELAALVPERDAIGVVLEQIPYQREMNKQKLEAAQQDTEALKEMGRQARERDAREELERIRKLAGAEDGASPLHGVALDVESLAAKLYGKEGALESLQEVTYLDSVTAQQLARLKQTFSAIQRRYEASPPFAPVSDWLQVRPGDASSLMTIRANRARQLRHLPELRKQIVSLEDQLSHESALETQIQQLKAGGAAGGDFDNRARTLLQIRRRLLDDLLSTDRRLDARLTEYDDTSRQLLQQALQLRLYVRKRILWARSAPTGLAGPLSAVPAGLAWFVNNPQWKIILAEAANRGGATMVWALAGIPVLLLLLARRLFPRATFQPPQRGPSEAGEGRHKLRLALLNVLLRAVGPPALLYWLSWFFTGDQMPPLGSAIAAGLSSSAALLFVISCLHELASAGGFGETWLHMPARVCTAIREQTVWLRFALPSLAFLVAALLDAGGLLSDDPRLQEYHNSLGRLAFLLILICLWGSARRVFRAAAPPLGSAERWAWRGVFFLIAAILLLAVTGFYLTALLMAKESFETAVLTGVLVGVYTLLMRWWERTRLAAQTGPGRVPRSPAAPEAQVMQLGRFVTTMVWIVVALIIWSDALPAVAMLNHVELFPNPRIVHTVDADAPPAVAEAGAATGGAPAAEPATKAEAAPAKAPVLPGVPATAPQSKAGAAVKSLKPFTLLDLVAVVLTILFAWFLLKNIPGVIELTVLRRFNLDRGAIYAVNTIARYIIGFLALGLISGLIGIQWSQVQWLAAALTFGIGFGLQDIFANFAAGLILLFDRSMRVGDAISLGDLSGRVTDIKMRATTVTMWDRSEMIVPNKEFITSKLINWTLTIPETRVDLKVGVAYESDLHLVRKLLRDVALANSDVLKEPPPEVWLMTFAESTINFELRVFCLYETGRLKVLDQLHMAVHRTFAENGIVIAYPQLDVHLQNPPQAGPARA